MIKTIKKILKHEKTKVKKLLYDEVDFYLENMKHKKIAITESDIEAAMSYLNQMFQLPYNKNKSLPPAWNRQRIVNLIKKAIGTSPNIDDCFFVVPGIWALIKPFGIDILGHDPYDTKLQVWLLIRPVGTAHDKIIII